MKGYTLKGFIKEYRPDGKGHIVVGDDDISFDEVVCDICNDLITQPEEEPDKNVIYVDEGWGVCENCYNKRLKR